MSGNCVVKYQLSCIKVLVKPDKGSVIRHLFRSFVSIFSFGTAVIDWGTIVETGTLVSAHKIGDRIGYETWLTSRVNIGGDIHLEVSESFIKFTEATEEEK